MEKTHLTAPTDVIATEISKQPNKPVRINSIHWGSRALTQSNLQHENACVSPTTSRLKTPVT